LLITWSDWRDISMPAFYNANAVYRIRLMNPGGPASINRLLGVDNNGLMCIGKTKNMEERRKQFANGLNGKYGHSEGNLLHILKQASSLPVAYPNAKYQYSFAKTDLGLEGKIEQQQIKVYVKEFGEVPPLNSAIPNRYGDW